MIACPCPPSLPLHPVLTVLSSLPGLTSLPLTDDDETSVATKGGYAGTNGLFGCGIYAGLTQDTSGVLAAAAKKVC